MRYTDVSGAISIDTLWGMDYQNPSGSILPQNFHATTLGTVTTGVNTGLHSGVTYCNASAASQVGYWSGFTMSGLKSYWTTWIMPLSGGLGPTWLIARDEADIPNTNHSVFITFQTNTNNIVLNIYSGGAVAYQDLTAGTFQSGVWGKYTIEWDIPSGQLNIYQNNSGILYTGTDYGISGLEFGQGYLASTNMQWHFDRPYQGIDSGIATEDGNRIVHSGLSIQNGNDVGNVFSDDAIYFRNIGPVKYLDIPDPYHNDRIERGALDVVASTQSGLDYYVAQCEEDIRAYHGENYDWNVVKRTPYKKDGVIWKQAIVFEEEKYEI